MSTQTVNLDTYSLSLLTAKEDILNPRSSTNWALFSYDGISNKLKLADSGVGGVAELAVKFHIAKPQYGLCRLGNTETGSTRIAMVNWVGPNVDDYRRTECADHIPAIKHFFKEAHVFLKAEKPEEVTEERIRAELTKAQNNASTQRLRRSSKSLDTEEIVGTNYRKTNAAMEMRRINRDSFWARAEREEEERKEEERKRAAEERRRLERERVLKERRDAEERDRKMNEKLRLIEEQRRKEAEQEEEQRRKETIKWEQHQREHEEDMRARLRRSESIEKAAEAAALVSQRSINPREFFRQLSSSSSQSPTSPSRTGKPFRRYQRSLTDTAFIFSKAEESTGSSPRSSPLVSPFFRAPPSPLYRATSPPTSPVFQASTSPQRTPLSPPLSPLRPSPPISALPSVPQTISQVKARAQSPTGPSAPPASPTLLASVLPPLTENTTSHSALPLNTTHSTEHNTFSFEPSLIPLAPTASIPERQQPNTDLFAAGQELVSDIGYKVQAVLVEEDEEEEEDVEGKDDRKNDTQSRTEPEPEPEEPSAVEKQTEEKLKDEGEPEQQEELEITAKTGDDEEPEDELKEAEDEKEEEERVEITFAPATLEEPVQLVQEEEEEKEVMDAEEVHDQLQENKGLVETAQLSQNKEVLPATDARSQSQEIKCVTADRPMNVIPNGDSQEHNGTDPTLSPSDTELDSPELAVYCDVLNTFDKEEEEEDIPDCNYTKVSENGQEVSAEQQMCVRALYDYQAEDESEISFEPGDIIRDVEAVDKAWWRGWSKDGHQGLFPANYVETISPQ